MPYEVKPVRGGFKVYKEGTRRVFSREPLTRETAIKQMRALYASDAREKKKMKK